MKKYIFILALLFCASFSFAQNLPFSVKNLEEILQVDDIYNYVYILQDIDGDKNPELFVKEKVKDYNNHWGLTINNGKLDIIIERESPCYTEYGYTDDGYFYMNVEKGGGHNYDWYKKLKNSKVVLELSYSYDEEVVEEGDDGDMDIQVTDSYYVSDGEDTEENYSANLPKGNYFSFYDLDGWKSFPAQSYNNSNFLAQQGQKFALVPSKWETQFVEADFNKDAIQDLALLTFPTDKNQDPIVAIYFGQKDKTYKLFSKNENLVSAYSVDEYNERIGGGGGSISVNAKGVITVRCEDDDPATDLGYTSMLFRYQNGDFYMIGKGVHEYDRMSHTGYHESYNFSTNKIQIKQDGKPDTWKDIEVPLKKFSEVNL
ncbi:MAG: hypothetical protein MJ211_04955 [Bacteroidales bacterium]|nr:hypothetical protein [Bacteroidales bacterium]